MVSYLACSVDEQRRVLKACPESPMYFTGSRAIAERIREIAPRFVASTGGPNTMVADQLTEGVADAARMSNLIEQKGQCTAMRHLVVPGISEADVATRVYGPGDACLAGHVSDSMAAGSFFSIFKDQKLRTPLPEGYVPLPGALNEHVAVRMSASLPVGIQEQWREAFLDVTVPAKLEDGFLQELASWCNSEQPITLAVNCLDPGVALQLFEQTSLVVYTVGHPVEQPALTCQARPQEGEVFGEVPPRRMMRHLTRFPVLVPSTTPGYNTSYTASFLAQQGEEPFVQWQLPEALAKLEPVVSAVQDSVRRGFCRQLLAYLADAATGPRRGVSARTTLFGLQRPPLSCTACLRLEESVLEERLFDEAVPFLLPFLATNAREQLVLSLDTDLVFSAGSMLEGVGLKIVREDRASFEKMQGNYWGVVHLPDDALTTNEHPLAAHFVSLLVAFGHVKSTKENDEDFLELFGKSAKWLRV